MPPRFANATTNNVPMANIITIDCAASVQMEARIPPAKQYSATNMAPATEPDHRGQPNKTCKAFPPATNWAAA